SDPASGSAVAGLSPSFERGGAAGDGSSALPGRFGAFVNGIYNFGDVDSTFDQVGFDYDGGGVTAGADYRFTDDLIAGVGFNYIHSAADFDGDGGDLDSDSYNGLVYGTYYLPDGVYVDGIATFGGINYDSTRNIRYRLDTEPTGGVNTQATAESNGWQYSVSGGLGYNYALGEVTLNPYARASYVNLDVDGFTEQGGDGWAMRFEDQEVESVTTTLGAQLSHSISTTFGVLLPYVQGEWHHEFEDDGRDIIVRFVGSGGNLPFNTVTEGPDRNYFTVGAGVSGTFAHGITGFFNYDALLGYDDIDSHLFTVGARMEF
ncbi:MAG: autotransporter outer membrane beta-barrel domain-containing protein, partial [Gammaproteobacteria bacterium]